MLIEFCSLTGIEEHASEEKWVKYENLFFKYEHKESVKLLMHQYIPSEETDNAGMYC